MRIIRIIAVLLIGVLLILAACTSPTPSNHPTTPTPAPEPAPIQGYTEIMIRGRNFNPEVVTVGVGTAVSWISTEGEQHTITSDIPDLFNGTIEPFGSFSYTFNERGDFEYYCVVHGQMGMRGVVHVR